MRSDPCMSERMVVERCPDFKVNKAEYKMNNDFIFSFYSSNKYTKNVSPVGVSLFGTSIPYPLSFSKSVFNKIYLVHSFEYLSHFTIVYFSFTHAVLL